jgi:hypothetical protein
MDPEHLKRVIADVTGERGPIRLRVPKPPRPRPPSVGTVPLRQPMSAYGPGEMGREKARKIVLSHRLALIRERQRVYLESNDEPVADRAVRVRPSERRPIEELFDDPTDD